MINPETFRVSDWLPEGRSGSWCVRRYTEAGQRLTCLLNGDQWWMDDSDKELKDTAEFLEAASGVVLITGLGMGAVPAWLSRQDEVSEIHVVENNPCVVDLVWPHLSRISNKIKLIETDARKLEVPHWFAGYNFAWHDIWYNSRDPEVQPEIAALIAHCAPFCRRQMVWIPSIPVRAA